MSHSSAAPGVGAIVALAAATWLLSAQVPEPVREASMVEQISAVRYAPPGWYIKDHCLIHHDGLWHLFGPLGRIGASWEDVGSEETAEHMTSPDLVHWTHVGTSVSASGEDGYFDKMMGGLAPHIVATDGTFIMFYSGWTFPSKRPNLNIQGYRQSCGLVTSKDLYQWSKVPEFERDGLGVQGTDPCVARDEANDRWLMYTWTGSVDVYASTDLAHWVRAGTAVTADDLGDYIGESPFVMKHPLSGKWVIFLHGGYSTSDDAVSFPAVTPYSFKAGWHPVPGVLASGNWGDGTNALADDDSVGFAHEIIEFQGQWYMTGIVGRDGRFKLKFTPFEWTDEFIELTAR